MEMSDNTQNGPVSKNDQHVLLLNIYNKYLKRPGARQNLVKVRNKTNEIEIMKKMRDDGFGELNWKDLELHLNKIAAER